MNLGVSFYKNKRQKEILYLRNNSILQLYFHFKLFLIAKSYLNLACVKFEKYSIDISNEKLSFFNNFSNSSYACITGYRFFYISVYLNVDKRKCFWIVIAYRMLSKQDKENKLGHDKVSRLCQFPWILKQIIFSTI